MKSINDTFYDENTDGAPFNPMGVFLGHVSNLEVRQWNNSYVLEFEVKLAKDNKDSAIHIANPNYEERVCAPKVDDNGELITMPGSAIVGKRYKTTGIWLTPSPKPGEGWKNRRYVDICENMGVTFKKMSNGKKKLGIIESDDVIGAPVMVKLAQEFFTTKDGRDAISTKITDILSWPDGKRLDPEDLEDLPF